MIRKLILTLCLLAAPTACAGSARDALRADADIVRRESTPEILLQRGDGFAAVGDATRAEQYYAAALAAGGAPQRLVRRLIRVCVGDQRYRAALAYAGDYLRRHPRDDEVRFARATIAAGVGETELARADLTRLAASAPNNAEVHFALAVLLRDDFSDLPRARAHFARYLALAPRGSNAAQARAAAEDEQP